MGGVEKKKTKGIRITVAVEKNERNEKKLYIIINKSNVPKRKYIYIKARFVK